jgi:hypothetical protein
MFMVFLSLSYRNTVSRRLDELKVILEKPLVAKDAAKLTAVVLEVDVLVIADTTEAHAITLAKASGVDDIAAGGVVHLHKKDNVTWIDEDITRLCEA